MKKIYTIVAAMSSATGGNLPEWYLIFPEGESEVEGEGKFIVDQNSWNLVKARIDRRGLEVVFDYEHQTLADTKAPAAGWCKEWRYLEGVGIEAKVDWTEEAAGYLAKSEYRYFSPVFFVRKTDGRLCAVHSVALTNAPKTNHLKPLLAKLGAEHKENDMDLLKLLIASLKLNEDATEAQVVAKVKELLEKDGEVVAKLPGDVLSALDLKEDDSVSTVVASIHALKQTGRGAVSREEFAALQRQLVERDADEVIAKAIGAGKITPDQKDWAKQYAAKDLEGFKTFVAKAPVVIPVDKLPESGQEQTTAELTGDVLKVAKLMDVSEEDLKQYGGLK
ncbi:phage protease [Desulfopila inferna]|uniref:phage protease n=1 Tax=Desulfopila inferna TaxID=468528 RepID=UPI001964ED28|nr:phage protease [Desulfopila inferna]MBM9605962.1 hypothetical protein [Desulfopila inferna]